MSDGIFPRKDADFNTYIGTAIPYLNTNAVRLGIDAGNLTDLGNLKTDWDIKYPQSQNENTATKTIIDEKIQLREDIEDKLRDIYDDIPKSALTTADRNTLNLKERKPNAPRPYITTAPDIILHAIGEARVQFELRVESDSSRPSMHPECDVADVRIAVGNFPSTPTINMVTDWFVSTRARFIKTADLNQLGMTAYVWVRWKNNTDETKSGPFNTTPVAVVIR